MVHRVALADRRETVFKQISGPVSSLRGDKVLSEVCSYIPYDAIMELSREERLQFMNDSIVDAYAEFLEE
jgi:hypothetical protein